MAIVKVVPKANTPVFHPDGRPLAPDGEIVERTSYWLRRERDCDVTLTDTTVPSPDSGAVVPAKAKK